MSPLMLLFTAISLAADAFAASVSIGLIPHENTKSLALKTGLCFGLFQGWMPWLGFFASRCLDSRFSQMDHWVAFFILGSIGVKMILDAAKPACAPSGALSACTLLLMALATSMDALCVGFSFALIGVDLLLAASLIALVTFLLCALGVLLGQRLSQRNQARFMRLGGCFLLLIGLRVLLEHLLNA